jgi:hypothetical protein
MVRLPFVGHLVPFAILFASLGCNQDSGQPAPAAQQSSNPPPATEPTPSAALPPLRPPPSVTMQHGSVNAPKPILWRDRKSPLSTTPVEFNPDGSFADWSARFAEARAAKRIMPCGNAELQLLYRRLKTSRDIRTLEKDLEAWIAEQPDDPAPLNVLADIAMERAWRHRGTGLAYTVSEAQFEAFHKELAVAKGYLDRALKLKVRDPDVYSSLISTALGLPTDREQVEAWAKEGSEAFPNYFPLYQAMANYLLPRWHGDEDDLPDYARSVLKTVPGDDGLEAFTRVLIVASEFDEPLLYYSGIDHRDILRGSKLLFQRYPDWDQLWDFQAFVGWRNLDQAFCQELQPKLAELKDGVGLNRRIWGSPEQFARFETFCKSPVPADNPEMVLFPNLDGTLDITLADSEHGPQLIAERGSQPAGFTIWNIDDFERPHEVLPAPDVTAVYDLKVDRLGRYLMGAASSAAEPHAFVYDRASGGNPVIIRASNPLRKSEISADGSRLVFVYDQSAEFWNPATGELITKIGPLTHMPGGSFCRLLSPDGKLLAVRSTDGFQIWNDEGKRLHHFPAQLSPEPGKFSVQSLIGFAADNSVFAGSTVLANNKYRFALTRHHPPTYAGEEIGGADAFAAPIATFSEHLFASVIPHPTTRAMIVKIHELKTGKCLRTIDGHTGTLRSAAFSPNGEWFVTLEETGVVRFWRVPKNES